MCSAVKCSVAGVQQPHQKGWYGLAARSFRKCETYFTNKTNAILLLKIEVEFLAVGQ